MAHYEHSTKKWKIFDKQEPCNPERVKYPLFGLQTNLTKKWLFYNIISVRNSNVLKYYVIVTSSKT